MLSCVTPLVWMSRGKQDKQSQLLRSVATTSVCVTKICIILLINDDESGCPPNKEPTLCRRFVSGSSLVVLDVFKCYRRRAIQKFPPFWGWTRKPLAVSCRSKYLLFSHVSDFRYHLPSSKTTDLISSMHGCNLNLWSHGQNKIQLRECIPLMMWQTILRCEEHFLGLLRNCDVLPDRRIPLADLEKEHGIIPLNSQVTLLYLILGSLLTKSPR